MEKTGQAPLVSVFLLITDDREGLIVNSKIYLVKNPES